MIGQVLLGSRLPSEDSTSENSSAFLLGVDGGMRVAEDGGGVGEVATARGEASGGGVLARAGLEVTSGRRSRNQERRRAVGVWSGEDGSEIVGRGARNVMSSIGVGCGYVRT